MQRFGRYKVLREVARGGMGVVLQALGPDGQDVALKLLLAGRGASLAQRQRFLREAQALLRLRHPGVVGLIDAGEAEGAPFLAMEWVEGESLEDRLARLGPLDPREAVELVRRAATALDYCHAQGVLHRDVKPANLLLRRSDGEPLLTDFGLTRDLEASLSGDLTAGGFMGTPGFAPPEQARGEAERVGPASDVWGLGALLYAALTAQPPIPGQGLLEVLAALDRPLRPPSAHRPGVPAALDRVCARALTLDPAARYPSAGALAEDLARWQRGEPLAARRRRGGRRALLALSAVAALVVGAALVLRARSAQPTSPPGPPRSGPAPEDVAQAAQRLEAARAAWIAGDVDLVRSRLAGVAELDPAQRLAVRLLEVDLAWVDADPQAITQACAAALALDPPPGERSLLRGIASMRDDPRQALRELEEATRLAPGRADPALYLALARYQQDDVQGALRDLERVLAAEPGFTLAWVLRSECLQRRGDEEGALQACERAIEVGPRLAGGWHGRGAIRLRRGELDGAIEDFRQACAVSPGQPNLLHTLGLALSARGELEAARAALDQALALAPRMADAWISRGLTWQRQNDQARAAADFERALQADPRHTTAWVDLGVARINLRQPRRALECFSKAVELEPGHAMAWTLRGEVRRMMGDTRGAWDDVTRALEADPSCPIAWFDRGVMQAEAGDPQAGAEDVARAIELLPPRSSQREEMQRVLAKMRAGSAR